MWIMKTLLTSVCINLRGTGQSNSASMSDLCQNRNLLTSCYISLPKAIHAHDDNKVRFHHADDETTDTADLVSTTLLLKSLSYMIS